MSINLKETLVRTSPAHYAVVDAMTVAQAKLLSDVIRNPFFYFEPGKTALDEVVETKTEGKCRVACSIVASYLANKYRELFRGIVILEALGGIKELISWKWNFHDNFLALDKNGTWYAGSPTNYRPEYPDDRQRITRLIHSKNLQDVLDTIEHEDEGLWPAASYIQEIFRNHELKLPSFDARGVLNGLVLTSFGNGREKVRAIPLYSFINGDVVLIDDEPDKLRLSDCD